MVLLGSCHGLIKISLGFRCGFARVLLKSYLGSVEALVVVLLGYWQLGRVVGVVRRKHAISPKIRIQHRTNFS